MIFIGGSTIPIARAAAQASGRPVSLFFLIFHMYLTKNKNIKPVCPGFKILLGPPMMIFLHVVCYLGYLDCGCMVKKSSSHDIISRTEDLLELNNTTCLILALLTYFASPIVFV
jgi:hypothetical protein